MSGGRVLNTCRNLIAQRSSVDSPTMHPSCLSVGTGITEAGFKYLLLDTFQQLWTLLRQYAAQVEGTGGEGEGGGGARSQEPAGLMCHHAPHILNPPCKRRGEPRRRLGVFAAAGQPGVSAPGPARTSPRGAGARTGHVPAGSAHALPAWWAAPSMLCRDRQGRGTRMAWILAVR